MSNPPSDLQIEVLSLPSNAASLPKAKKNDPIEVHYVGTLFNGGAKFDSSRDRNKRFPFTLGAEQVIKGWDEGIVGMVPGELRRLIIPPHKAYGDRGFPGLIPANSTLVFEVELLSIGGRHRDL
ncbi:hypothetical protein CPB86DRAFT_791442 [Serendipita vermifera]|nr:hypothetical protein CPB86DRAFT_791442 [Serendipita vermifera]